MRGFDLPSGFLATLHQTPGFVRALVTGIALSAFAGGCASFSFQNDRIIERSARERPAWIAEPPSAEPSSEAYASYLKKDVHRLDLGLKQAQASAIQHSRALFFSRLRKELTDRAKGLYPRGDLAALEISTKSSFEAVQSAFVPQEGTPKDIYWENVERRTDVGPRTHYDIWVLVSFRKEELFEALGNVAQKLQKSPNEQARNFGNTILKSFQ